MDCWTFRSDLGIGERHSFYLNPPVSYAYPGYFAENHGISPLYAKGIKGQGFTLGIVTLAALSPSAPTYFWKTFLSPQLKTEGTSSRPITDSLGLDA